MSRAFSDTAHLLPTCLAPLLLAALAPAGCGRSAATVPPAAAASPPPWFAEVADSSGLAFAHRSGHQGKYLFPEVMGGGAALFDMDGDGDLDAYLVQSGSLVDPPPERPGNQLFRNRGDGTFDDVSAPSGADDRGYGMGVAAGDYDNDGDLDLYVTNVGPNVLLQNDGRGRFTDVTRAAGVGDAGWGASAAFFDYDRDGDLDLYCANYIVWSLETDIACKGVHGRDYCGPQVYGAPAGNTLYRNGGDGTFRDVTAELGIREYIGNSLGVVCGDFDADGWIDIFVANDSMFNELWMNEEGRRFRNDALVVGCAVDHAGEHKAGMGVTASDFDGDCDLDLLIVNLERETDTYYQNDQGYFSEHTQSVGLAPISRPLTRFGVGAHDFDNDGRLDLYIANGAISRAALRSAERIPFAQPNLLIRGTPDGKFTEVLPRGGTAAELQHASRAAAFGDVDGDGGIDVLVANKDGPAYLLHNWAPGRGNWILLRAVDARGRDALGAVVTLSLGGRRVRRDVAAAYSYQASNDPRVHFGLGSAKQVEGVTVLWPDAASESFGDFAANQVVTLRQGTGQP